MLFHSPSFILIFLPATLLIYYALRRVSGRLAIVALILASLVFYGWWDPSFVVLLLGSAGANYLIGRMLSEKRRQGQITKPLLVIGIIANLALLGFFKYVDFFIANINVVTSIDVATLQIALPLAISFFTFQQIAFLVDVHAGATEDPDPITYLLFVSFFPQLIAGPIVHHREMMPQFSEMHRNNRFSNDVACGLTIFSIGLFKKTVIADHMAFFADRTFATAALGGDVTLIEAWVGTVAFSFQIYFDFSGYTDMAIGLGRMFGIRLPQNFASPYKATSIIDFWRRWHMTLSRFLRDYLYVPLGGGHRGEPRRHLNILIVMLLGGLWHGAAWAFVIWGAAHGAFLVVNHLWRKVFGITKPGFIGTFAFRALTFLAVTVAWVPFRAGDMDATLNMLRGLIGLNGIVLPFHYEQALGAPAAFLRSLGVEFGFTPLYGGGTQILTIILALAIVWYLPNTEQMMRNTAGIGATIFARTAKKLAGRAAPLLQQGVLIATGMIIGSGAAILALRQLQGQAGEFIYFQF
jgi:D-alanyl-lipoteichoic acid acyltransferase DltB (MBOAT superfamily)